MHGQKNIKLYWESLEQKRNLDLSGGKYQQVTDSATVVELHSVYCTQNGYGGLVKENG